jgi:hypothetical protein
MSTATIHSVISFCDLFEDTYAVMPDVIRHPETFYDRIALKLHFVPGFHRNDDRNNYLTRCVY